MNNTFDAGCIFLSTELMKMCKADVDFPSEIKRSITRFKNCDWGDIPPRYYYTNGTALDSTGEIFASYPITSHKYPDAHIYAIQEERGDNTYLFYSEELKR